MNERQYEQMILRRQRPATGLFERKGVARWLERVARQTQRLEDAQAAWERVVDPEEFAGTRVSAFADGRLTIAAPDSSLRFALLRRERALTAALRPFVPGMRELRFTPAE